MDFSILHMFQQMGLVAKGVVILLLFMSVYAIAVSVERCSDSAEENCVRGVHHGHQKILANAACGRPGVDPAGQAARWRR